MIESFFFLYINLVNLKAPGEAEAELALLNRLGIIDAVMTEDSDIFAYGAQLVIRG